MHLSSWLGKLAPISFALLLAACGSSSNAVDNTGPATAAALARKVPAVPTGLAATAGNAQVSLSWSASPGATSYILGRDAKTGGPVNNVTHSVSKPFIKNG